MVDINEFVGICIVSLVDIVDLCGPAFISCSWYGLMCHLYIVMQLDCIDKITERHCNRWAHNIINPIYCFNQCQRSSVFVISGDIRPY